MSKLRLLIASLIWLAAVWLGSCQPPRVIEPLPDPPMGVLLAAPAAGSGSTHAPPPPPPPPPPGGRRPVRAHGEPGWRPPVGGRRWTHIVIHHSDSDYGNAALFDDWHRQRGWDGLGYHFVICNGNRGADGAVEVGYRWTRQLAGAHTSGRGLGVYRQSEDRYYNKHGVGICVVGNFMRTRPTERQMQSLARLCRFLMQTYGIPKHHVIGHCHTKSTLCPGRYFSFADLYRRLGH
jgi:hypothetical protein